MGNRGHGFLSRTLTVTSVFLSGLCGRAVVSGCTKDPYRNNCAILAADASLLHPNAAAALGTPGLAAFLVAYIRPVCALLAPCQAGASTPMIGALISARALSTTAETANAIANSNA